METDVRPSGFVSVSPIALNTISLAGNCIVTRISVSALKSKYYNNLASNTKLAAYYMVLSIILIYTIKESIRDLYLETGEGYGQVIWQKS